MVTKCPLFYSDKDKIIEIPPPDEREVVEVAPPPPSTGGKGGGGICLGVSSQTSILRFHCMW